MGAAGLIPQRDQAIFGIPPRWHHFPDEILKGMCWWYLVDLLLDKRKQGNSIIVSPLTKVDITIVHGAVDLMAVESRCDCENCKVGWATGLQALESGAERMLAVVYYEYLEAVDVSSFTP